MPSILSNMRGEIVCFHFKANLTLGQCAVVYDFGTHSLETQCLVSHGIDARVAKVYKVCA